MVIMSDGRPMTATAFVKRGGGGRVRRWRGDPLAKLYEILGGREPLSDFGWWQQPPLF